MEPTVWADVVLLSGCSSAGSRRFQKHVYRARCTVISGHTHTPTPHHMIQKGSEMMNCNALHMSQCAIYGNTSGPMSFNTTWNCNECMCV